MKRASTLLAVLVASLALVASGCGSSGDVPDGAVAVVDGTEIPTTELDALLVQVKAGYKAQKQEFPTVGTPEYQSVQQQYVAFLVQKAQFKQAADELGIEVTDADVEKTRDQLLEDRFKGDEKRLADELEAQGLDEEGLRETLRVSLLSDKIFKAVTKDVKVADAEALQAYTQSKDSYQTLESRQVRHILLSEKDANGQIDFAKSKAKADQIYAQLKSGADFAALAKANSEDSSSAANGGEYLAERGKSVAAFDKAAFALDTNEISRPVKTEFGYHVIQPIADAKPGKVTKFDEVKASIKAGLLSQKQSEVMTKWVQELQKDYEGKVSYATGFAPAELPEADPADDETVTE